MFELTIKTDNAAFRDDDDTGDNADATRSEVARILRETARRILNGTTDGALRDANGNKVGHFALDLEDENP